MVSDNMNNSVSHLRDTYLMAEKEYIKELIKDDRVIELIRDFNQLGSDVLFQLAQDLVTKVENNEFSYEEMELVEKKLIVLLAAIKDKVLIKELVLLPENEIEEEMHIGRSR